MTMTALRTVLRARHDGVDDVNGTSLFLFLALRAWRDDIDGVTLPPLLVASTPPGATVPCSHHGRGQAKVLLPISKRRQRLPGAPYFHGVCCGVVTGDASPPLSSSSFILGVLVSKGIKRRMKGFSRLVFILMTTSNGTDRDSARSAVRCCEWKSSETVRLVFNFEKVVLMCCLCRGYPCTLMTGVE